MPTELSGIKESAAVAQPAKPAPVEGVRFRRNLFVEGQNTGLNIDKAGRPVTGEKAKDNEWISQSDALRNQYRRFLGDYIQRLTEIQKQNPTVLTGKEHGADRNLMALLAGADQDATDKKIQAFLNKPEGWMIATQVMEQQTAYKMFALGLIEASKPLGERKGIIDETHIHLDIGQSRINRWWHNKTDGLGSGIMDAVRDVNPLRGGLIIDIKQSADVLLSIQNANNSAAEKAYLREMYGIDIDHYKIAPKGEISVNPYSESTVSPSQLQTEVVQALYARRDFYASLGIPDNVLDAMPEQYLFRYSDESRNWYDPRKRTDNVTFGPEQTGAKWQRRIAEAFKQNNGGIVDTLQRPVSSPDFLKKAQNAGNLNPGGDKIDYSASLQHYREARAQVMTEMIQEYMKREMINANPDRPLTTIKEKINARTGDGAEVKKRREVHEKKKTRYEAYKGLVSGDRGKVEAYRKAADSLRKAREAASREGYATTAAIDTAIQGKYKELRDRTAGSGSVAEERDNIKKAIETEIDTRRKAAEAGFTAKTSDQEKDSKSKSIRDSVQQLYKGDLDALAERERKINEEIAKLQGLKDAITGGEAQLKDTEDVVTETNKVMDAMSSSFDTLTSATGLNIADADLRTKTVDEIMDLIHQKNKANAALGWPESGDAKEANRLLVIRAMNEARAKGVETARANNATLDGDLKAVKLFVSENELRVLTKDDLIKKITSNTASGWSTPPTAAELAQLTNAIAEAQNRLDLRFGNTKDLLDAFDKQIEAAQDALEGVSLKDEVDRLTMTRELMERQSEVFSRSTEITLDPGKFTDTGPVQPTDSTLSESERKVYSGTAQYPKGYLEMMNLFFDYRERPDRNDYFQKIVTALPPSKLTEILVAGGLQGTDINSVLTDLKNKMASGELGPLNLQQLTKGVINRLRDEALAM